MSKLSEYWSTLFYSREILSSKRSMIKRNKQHDSVNYCSCSCWRQHRVSSSWKRQNSIKPNNYVIDSPAIELKGLAKFEERLMSQTEQFKSSTPQSKTNQLSYSQPRTSTPTRPTREKRQKLKVYYVMNSTFVNSDEEKKRIAAAYRLASSSRRFFRIQNKILSSTLKNQD